jgi:hypothetical protein
VAPEVLLFAGAGILTLAAFTTLILVPAVGSFGRTWEKITAGLLSLVILVVLVTLGVAIGFTIIWFWDEISPLFS